MSEPKSRRIPHPFWFGVSAMKVTIVTCMLVLACTAETAFAQRRRGFSRRTSALSVAMVPAVAKKLNLTDEQTVLAKKLRDEVYQLRQELFQGFRDLSREERAQKRKEYNDQRQEKEQQLAESVGEKKIKRIRQLSLQAGGFLSAVFSREIREKLEISDEQRNQAFGELREMREEFTAAEDDAEALSELYKKADEKITAVITDDQKSKWKKMLGEPAEEELLAKIRAAVRRRR